MSDLGFLEKLLDGAQVEWKPLIETVKINRGKRLIKSQLEETGRYPVYQNSMKPLGYYHEANVSSDSAFIICAGSAGEIGFSRSEFWAADDVYFFEPPQTVLSRYLYHWLLTEQRFILSQVRKGVVPRLAKPIVERLSFPIPCPDDPEKSLAIQGEIVRILDSFTELTAELTAALELRKKQYNHYRDQLLTFEEGEVEWAKIGDLAEVRSGWGFPKTFQGKSEGRYPFYKVSDMNLPRNGAEMVDANNRIDQTTRDQLGVKPAPAGTVIFPKIGAAIATNKKRSLTEEAAYDNNVMGLVPDQRIVPKFLYFWMQTVDISRWASDSGAVPSIRKSTVEAVEMPVPSLAEQSRIVEILDTFDTLTTSLSAGLPREIELRQKQYEYYRDLLLSFPKPADQSKAAA